MQVSHYISTTPFATDCACSHMVVVVTLPDQEECLTNASVCVCQ